ncbi:hypothetical protein ACI8AV_21160 [Geodermatophilus sp. SYSU D00804]
MTAGQGPQGWDQPGQDPYGQGAYGQGAYGQGAYGQGPHGQGAHGGYASAPAAPDGFGAPAPVERPSAVVLGVGAFAATLVLGLVNALVTFADVDGFIAQVQAASPDVAISESAARAALVAGAGFALVLVALQVLFLWFAWKGRNWARIVLWVLGGLGVAGSLVGFLGGGAPTVSGLLTVLSLASLLLTVVGIVALAQKPASAWYRYQGWRRAQGR